MSNVTVRVDMGTDKVSYKARTDRAQLVDTMAKKTDLYKTSPTFQQMVDDLVAAGVHLSEADAAINQLEAALDKARSERDEARKSYDQTYAPCVKQVEKCSTTPADVQSYGFRVLDKIEHNLQNPTEIATRYNVASGVLHLHVKYGAAGSRRCVIEVSPDPMGADTFTRLEGTGVKRSLSGYAPGLWWVRAATSTATGRSDWVGPVSVRVK